MEQLQSALEKANNILIISKNILSYDKASALVSMQKALGGNGKVVDVLLVNPPSSKLQTFLDRYEFTYITEVKPRLYEIWVNYGKSGVEKVSYDIDQRDEKLKFSIVPGSGEFNFDDVEFKEGGSEYDLTVTFGIADYKKLGKLYDENEYLFKNNFILSFLKDMTELGDVSVNIDSDGSYSEAVYNLVKETGIEIKKDVVELLLNGTINHRKVIEGNAGAESWEVISSMAASGADVSKVVNDVYYSKSDENLKLQIKLMQNVKMEGKIIWSYLSTEDLKSCGVSRSNLDLNGRISYNLSKEYDFALALYQIEEEKILCVVESNKPEEYPASSIAGIWNGKGGDSHAQFTMKGSSKNSVWKEIIPSIKDIFELSPKNKGKKKGSSKRGRIPLQKQKP